MERKSRASGFFTPKTSSSDLKKGVDLPGTDPSPVSFTQTQRCKILGLPIPKSTNINLTIINHVTNVESSKQIRCTSTTRIREILKKLSTEKNWTKRASLDRLSPYADDEVIGTVEVPQTESSYGLFLPADKAGLLPSDEVKLEEDYAIFQYDMAPVQTLHWKEIPFGLNYSGYLYLRISVYIGGHHTSMIVKCRQHFTVRDTISLIQQRIPSKTQNITYGLYVRLSSGVGDEEGFLTLMDLDKSLEYYKLSSMDILEFKAISLYEFAFLTSGTAIDHPDSLALPENLKIHELVTQIKNYVVKETHPLQNDEFGLLYIPTKNHADLTQFKWMEGDRVIADYNPQQYDIFEFRKRLAGAVTSTLEVNSDIPATKLILVSGPTSPDNKPGQLNTANQVEELSLESGERKIFEEPSVSIYNQVLHKALWGSLIVTNYQLIFIPDEKVDSSLAPLFRIPVASIAKFDKVGITKDSLDIYCKDLRAVTFEFSGGRESRRSVVNAIDQVSYFGHTIKSFAYSYSPLKYQSTRFQTSKLNGWNVFTLEEEFKRLFQNITKLQWRISTVNQDFKLSDTYPPHFIVPAIISDEVLKIVALYRSKGRLPVLSWIHPFNNAALLRSSQPLVSLKRNRSVEDEALLNTIRELSMSNNQYLYIYDARPKANAVANVAVGGGFENTNFYTNTVLEFLNIANIHAMRESLNKLQNITDLGATWMSQLENTNWLEHIRLLLEGTGKIIDTMQNGSSVLLHCSDGWDRTAQFSALVQLCLDPHSRTIVGFASLIEKEWVSMGHKFNERIGHGKATDEEQRSPVFLQFIDCVYQLLCQFPCSFEFTDYLLITILDALYSCKYGTFLFNNERERAENGLRQKTVSLWTFVLSETEGFINPFYVASTAPLRPVSFMEDIVFWKGYYLRYQRRKGTTISKEERGKMLQNTVQNLTDRLKESELELAKLKEELENAKKVVSQ